MKVYMLLLSLLGSLCLCIDYATPARPTAASRRSGSNNNTITNSNNSNSRGVAQYKLPLGVPTNEALQLKSGVDDRRTESPTKRRRTQIVMRRRPVISTTITTTTSSTTTSTTTTPRPSLANGFNFFNPNFWSFGQQSLVAVQPPTKTSHPPKKFTSKDAIPSYRKQVKITQKSRLTTTTTTSTTTTTTTPKPSTTTSRSATDGPFRIALPTLNFPTAAAKDKEKDKRATAELRLRFNCPRENEVRFQLFPKICKTDKDCAVWQRDELCCDIFGSSSCVSGVAKPLEEASHAPILGLIPRKCPSRPLAELWWDVQECSTDMDCWPRVCCPDGRRRYCRTSQPELETVPVPVKRSFDYLSEYLECTAPPPPIFDLHPKACTSTLDCFPNVCCQEAGLRHCRPPKKSVLTLMANFLNVDFVKRLTQNIVIK
ncbi:uncharacterized protein Dwil_GK11968 [Drosophila willistoni]|uniref:WAP domain-containing protein n=1 Tax=Drosophila willistoni TaxID=7260 RepID=B4N808_DROWI|nr:uncharacterized protein LOC6647051 [Drosophila willistoni]EDW81259.2 uncharacterized protein Dwil_GK11968 [Drosophila willistoni]